MSARLLDRDALTATWRRIAFAFQITLERRLWIFLAVDAVMVLQGILASLVAGDGLDGILSRSVFYPTVLVCLPALSGSVALERRAGSLDLALAMPSTERYFLARLVPICGLFALQGCLFLTFSYIEICGGWMKALTPNVSTGAYLRSLLQCLSMHAFVVALVSFWAVRLRTAGGVWIASLISMLVLRSALLADPTVSSALGSKDFLFGIPRPLLTWLGSILVVGLATLILYLYARERLRRPETILD